MGLGGPGPDNGSNESDTVSAVRTTWTMPAGSGDGWADAYERGRPGWPAAVIGIAHLPPSATVLDLGAGTGKLTRLLASRFERVVAVEPADTMRRLLAQLCPRAEALAGTAQEIPLADASVEAVFAAEAFHWFDDERALAEIVRVLRPRGALVLTWNLPAGRWEPPIAHCYYIAPKAIKTTREFVINNFFADVFSVQLTLNEAGKILDVKKLKTLYAKKQPRLG